MLQKIADTINNNQVFLITAHVRSDGDSIGSTLGLYHMLRDMGKTAVLYHQDLPPGNYRFLPGSDRIVQVLPPEVVFDAVFILDCSELERVGDEAQRIGAMRQVINIDHHVSNGHFCELAYIDPRASSTAELIFRLAEQMKFRPSKEMADNLYAGILTDTGGFRYGSTSTEALSAAAHLVADGADPQWLSENIYENNPAAKIRLLAEVLKTLFISRDGRVASLTVSRKAVEDAEAKMEHTEGFVDLPRTISGVVVAILFSELDDRLCKVSLRSKGHYNVARIAALFGGGGHVNASACRCEGDIETVRKDILKAIEDAV